MDPENLSPELVETYRLAKGRVMLAYLQETGYLRPADAVPSGEVATPRVENLFGPLSPELEAACRELRIRMRLAFLRGAGPPLADRPDAGPEG